MSAGGTAPAPAPVPAGMVVTEHHIAEALDSLLRDTSAFTSFSGVIQQLESKLGVDLSSRLDFVHSRIQHFIRLQAQQMNFMPQQYHHHHHQERFALQQTPLFHPASQQPPHNFAALRPMESYAFRPQPHRSQLTQTPHTRPVVVMNNPAENPATVSAKESAPPVKKRKGGPGGLNKPCGVSPQLQTIVGQATLPRTEIVKQLWAYIRKNNLQDPNNKRKIICNDELRLVFETDCTDMFKMNKLLAKHILPLEQTKQTAHKPKKRKVDDLDSGSKRDDPVPIVIISDALASFFGSDEREMSQAEVLRQMWEYVKVNQLEDPLNPTSISCDAKLKELLGCEAVSALGIPDMLAQQHLYKKP